MFRHLSVLRRHAQFLVAALAVSPLAAFADSKPQFIGFSTVRSPALTTGAAAAVSIGKKSAEIRRVTFPTRLGNFIGSCAENTDFVADGAPFIKMGARKVESKAGLGTFKAFHCSLAPKRKAPAKPRATAARKPATKKLAAKKPTPKRAKP